MKTKVIDFSTAKCCLVMGHLSDGRIGVVVEGTGDELLRLICDSINVTMNNDPDYKAKIDEKDFPLILLAGIDLYCLNSGVTLEDLINDMRSRISLSIPNNKK